jgi:hypothetical protein
VSHLSQPCIEDTNPRTIVDHALAKLREGVTIRPRLTALVLAVTASSDLLFPTPPAIPEIDVAVEEYQFPTRLLRQQSGADATRTIAALRDAISQRHIYAELPAPPVWAKGWRRSMGELASVITGMRIQPPPR